MLGLAVGTSAHGQVLAETASAPELQAEIVKEEPLISDKVMGAIQEVIERVDLKAKIISAEDFDQDLGYGFRWDRRLEPSYKKDFMTLVDDYQGVIGGRSSPLRDPGEDVGYGVGAEGRIRFMFARQHEGNKLSDNLKTLIAKPYTPFTHFPSNSRKAMEKLRIGDFFLMQANMNVVASASQLKLLSPNFPVTVGAYYLVSGEFQIHMFRVSETKFRLKLIGVRSRDMGGAVRLGYDPDSDLKIIGVGFLDKQIRRRLTFAPVEIGFNLPETNLFMVDYILDFADPEAARAYDDLITSSWTKRTVKIVKTVGKIMNPATEREVLLDMVLADVARFEELYEREKNKSAETRLVDRMFSGNNDGDGSGIYIRIGHRDLGQYRFNQTYMDNYITASDRNGISRYFYMPVFTMIDEGRAGFGFWKEEVQRTATLLFEMDRHKGNITTFGELSFYLEYRDKKFDAKEARGLKTLISKRIPQELYDRINWGEWAEDRERRNARVTSLLVFRPGALGLVAGISGVEMYNRFVAYLNSLPRIDAYPENSNLDSNPHAYSSRPDWKFADDINLIVQNLVTVFNPAVAGKARVDTFTSLRRNPLFQEVGPGFLVNLLRTEAKNKDGDRGIDELLQHIYYETHWSAKDADTLVEVFGPCRNRRLYQAVMYIYSVLHNRSIDLRLIGDENIPKLPDKFKDAECSE
jgi:hypothetical protein